MKSLRDRNDKIAFNSVKHKRGFSNEELTLLEDLLIFNRRYEEVFFNTKIDDDKLELIDSVIDDKLKSISPTLAFKFLNRIWTIYNEGDGTLDAKIINGIDFDLAANRLTIQLLDRATDDISFLNNYNTRSRGLGIYLDYNFYNKIYGSGLKANKMLALDHVELFLTLLNESKNIDKHLIDYITDVYLFLYKDIYDEVLRNNLTKDSAVILAQRFNGYEKYIINHKTDIKERNFSIQFASEAVSMLTYKDKDLTENDLEYLKAGKVYLDSILMLLKDFEIDKVLSVYQESEQNVDTRECTKSLSYVKKSIAERDEKSKRNS